MQKQKTLAKWLAIILLCSVAVGSYVLYDALYLKKQDNEASADNGQGNQVLAPEIDAPVVEEHIPYYTTLPRESETIDNLIVTHFGGEDDDILHDVINFGKKRYAIFSSNSVEFDMRKKGLSLAIIEDGVERVTTLSDKDTYIDGKASSNGVAILTKNEELCTLYFVNNLGEKTAEIHLEAFVDGMLYLSGQNLLLFTISKGYLGCQRITDSLNIDKSPFVIKTDCAKIIEAFDIQSGQGLILGDDKSTSIYTFDQNKGFKHHFQEDKLSFKQIITAGTANDCNYIIYGLLGDKPWLYAFNTDFQMLSAKQIDTIGDGVILPHSDGLIFIGNGATKSYCKHLDEVLSQPNNLSFLKSTLFTFSDGAIMSAIEDGFGSTTLLYADGEIILTKPFEYNGEIVGIQGNFKSFSILINTSSTTDIFRASFGKIDPFIIDLDLSFFAESQG